MELQRINEREERGRGHKSQLQVSDRPGKGTCRQETDNEKSAVAESSWGQVQPYKGVKRSLSVQSRTTPLWTKNRKDRLPVVSRL